MKAKKTQSQSDYKVKCEWNSLSCKFIRVWGRPRVDKIIKKVEMNEFIFGVRDFNGNHYSLNFKNDEWNI